MYHLLNNDETLSHEVITVDAESNAQAKLVAAEQIGGYWTDFTVCIPMGNHWEQVVKELASLRPTGEFLQEKSK